MRSLDHDTVTRAVLTYPPDQVLTKLQAMTITAQDSKSTYDIRALEVLLLLSMKPSEAV